MLLMTMLLLKKTKNAPFSGEEDSAIVQIFKAFVFFLIFKQFVIFHFTDLYSKNSREIVYNNY